MGRMPHDRMHRRRESATTGSPPVGERLVHVGVSRQRVVGHAREHGGGGTGRLVGVFGALVHSLGYSYVAPDLPGFGLTVPEGLRKWPRIQSVKS